MSDDFLCEVCFKPILGNGVKALTKSFHKDCFKCHYCHKVLSTALFYEHDGKAYCEKDYDHFFTTRCELCSEIIIINGVKALGKNFHKEHFQCGYCREVLDEKVFFEKNGVAFCESDYRMYISPTCAQCNGAIDSDAFRALGKIFHKEHFQCNVCHQVLNKENFFSSEGVPYCKKDYGNFVSTKCEFCKEPILEDGVKALSKNYHKDHFQCAHCKQQLNIKNFIEHNGIPYCSKDFHNLFSPKCAYCDEAIVKGGLTALGKTWHPEHCFCVHCCKAYDKDNFREKNGKPYCGYDYKRLFESERCVGCHKIIEEGSMPVKTSNNVWHPNCFSANF